MQLEKGYLYHIYNQGNNKRRLFFNRENYLFFVKKIKTFVSPYADIIAWCLMPNHFHLLVLVNKVELEKNTNSDFSLSDSATKRTLNDSIGIMLRSYTRAINKQEGFTGALFRKNTKAECINCHKGLTPSFFLNKGATKINYQDPKKQYPQICFDYIHQNPVRARLVENEIDWEFSSAADYFANRKGTLLNKEVALEYIDIE